MPNVPPQSAQSRSAQSESAPSARRQRILLVTGLLGAGKTTALRELEDLGWEIIDNFPIRLLDRLLESPSPDGDAHAAQAGPQLAVGFDTRTRGFDPQAIIQQVKSFGRKHDLELNTLFIDCSSAELERRYNETRRRHPRAADMPASAGIREERELLAPLRRWADMLIDTTEFSSNELRQVIRERFAPADGQPLTITVSSFGFSRGMPPIADLVFDMRFLDNPHWDDQLRPLTGKDAGVGAYIRRDPAFEEAFARIRDLILMLLPRYRAQGKAYVHIAFGCTGGRHRSVYVAEQIAQALRQSGFSPTLLHRNLGSRAVDLLERGQRDEA
ncbi:MAG TPA: RNase adapter RapZ [Novosphingobium sp.]|nr:RNase adapter RapZ [Novosphingobium sp.]